MSRKRIRSRRRRRRGDTERKKVNEEEKNIEKMGSNESKHHE
jgi:hypothetical protein